MAEHLLCKERVRSSSLLVSTTPNLAVTLGVPPERAQEMIDLPRNMMERQLQEDGTTKTVFIANTDEIISNYSAPGPDGIRLLVMGKVNHGGAG